MLPIVMYRNSQHRWSQRGFGGEAFRKWGQGTADEGVERQRRRQLTMCLCLSPFSMSKASLDVAENASRPLSSPAANTLACHTKLGLLSTSSRAGSVCSSRDPTALSAPSRAPSTTIRR